MFCFDTYINKKSRKTVLAKFPRQFDFNHFPHKSMIYRLVEKFKSKGTVLKLSVKSEKVTTGCYLSVRVPGNPGAVCTSVGRSPTRVLTS